MDMGWKKNGMDVLAEFTVRVKLGSSGGGGGGNQEIH